MCQSNENVISSDVFLVQPEHSDCRSEREACGDHAQCVYQVGEAKQVKSIFFYLMDIKHNIKKLTIFPNLQNGTNFFAITALFPGDQHYS